MSGQRSTLKAIVLSSICFLFLFINVCRATDNHEVILSPASANGEGTMSVVIYPESIRSEARWRIVGETTWYISGQIISRTNGGYEVEFNDVPGWTTPPNTNALSADWGGDPNAGIGTYIVSSHGQLKISFLPANIGAKWRIVGESQWHNGGDLIENVIPGIYNIQCSNVNGWIAPGIFSVTVVGGQLYAETKEYKIATGAVVAYLNPETVVKKNASWYVEGVNGSNTRYRSGLKYNGQELKGLYPGNYQIHFNSVHGWSSPNSKSISVEAGKTTTIQSFYLAGKGQITGRIVSESGGGISNIEVQLIRKGEDRPQKTLSKSLGEFGFYSLEAGDYFVQVNSVLRGGRARYSFSPSFAEVFLSQGEMKDLGDFRAVSETGDYTIAGRVTTDLGYYVNGVKLSLSNGQSVTSDSYGYFRFDDLFAQKYILKVDPQPEIVPIDCSLSGYSGKKISSNTLIVNSISSASQSRTRKRTSFEVAKKNLKISGQVVNQRGAGIYHRLETHLFQVKTRSFAGQELESFTLIAKASVDMKGEFEFSGLMSGKYAVGIKDFSGLEREFVSDRLRATLVASDKSSLRFTMKRSVKNSQYNLYGLTISANSIEETGQAKLLASGNVKLGLLSLVNCPRITVNTNDLMISGNGKIEIPQFESSSNIELINGNFDLQLRRGMLELPIPKEQDSIGEFNFRGITFKPKRFWLEYDLLQCEADVTDFPLFGSRLDKTESTAVFRHSKGNGLELMSFTASVDELNLYGDWKLRNVKVVFNRNQNSFSGKGEVSNKLMTLKGEINLEDGKITKIWFDYQKEVLIKPPYLWMTNLSGLYTKNWVNIATPPNSASVSAHLVVSPKNSRIPLVEGDVTAVFFKDSNFRAWGNNLEILKIPIDGKAEVYYEYDGPENRSYAKMMGGDYISASGEMEIGRALKFSGDVDLIVFFERDTISGEIDADLDIAGYSVADVSASFSNNPFRIYVSADVVITPSVNLLLTTIPAVTVGFSGKIQDGHFTVSRPEMLKWMSFAPGEESKSLISKSLPKSEIEEKEFKVSESLKELQFLVIADQGLPALVITDSLGQTIDLSGENPQISVIRNKKHHVVSVRIQNPSSGNWLVELKNSSKLGGVYMEAIEYQKSPAISIDEVINNGNNEFTATFSRTQFSDEMLEIFVADNPEGIKKQLVATNETLSSSNKFDWNASGLKPGNYYIFAKVYNESGQPYVASYTSPIVVEGDLPECPANRPTVKLRKKNILVSWPKVDNEDLRNYKIYFLDQSKPESMPEPFIASSKVSRYVVPTAAITSGRTYKVAVSAVYNNGMESDLSKARKFKYKLKNGNNAPYFRSQPSKTVNFEESWIYTPVGKDYDNDQLAYSLLKGPEGMAYDHNTKTFSWTPDQKADFGYNKVIIMITDSKGASDTQEFKLQVRNIDNQGKLQNTVITDSNGNRKHLITYFNRDINDDAKLYEKVGAEISSSSLGTIKNIVLKELPNRPGMFVAEVPEESLYKEVRKLASSRVQAAAEMAKPIIVKIKGKKGPKRVLAK
jgi:hypothetical protein